MPGLMNLGFPFIGEAGMAGDDGAADQTSAAALGELTFLSADNRDLRAEVERLRGERDRMQETQRRVMELLGTTAPERIVHDLRNVLNERELFKALAGSLE